jgi:hypothetical protein
MTTELGQGDRFPSIRPLNLNTASYLSQSQLIRRRMLHSLPSPQPRIVKWTFGMVSINQMETCLTQAERVRNLNDSSVQGESAAGLMRGHHGKISSLGWTRAVGNIGDPKSTRCFFSGVIGFRYHLSSAWRSEQGSSRASWRGRHVRYLCRSYLRRTKEHGCGCTSKVGGQQLLAFQIDCS